MNDRNKKSPWNPLNPVQISPKEYEGQVVEWLRNGGKGLENFKIEHLAKISGYGGEYEFDAVADFSVFDGANITVLVECKRYNRPVEREVVLSLHSKLRDVGAHKGMIFSTAGFQRGAIEYASQHGIATITFIDGKTLYETRSQDSEPVGIPDWVELPKFAGYFLTEQNQTLRSTLIDNETTESLRSWLENIAP
jgi:restriction system protein